MSPLSERNLVLLFCICFNCLIKYVYTKNLAFKGLKQSVPQQTLGIEPNTTEHEAYLPDITEPETYLPKLGGGPRVVVSTAAFHARVRGSVPGLGGFKETKNVSSPSTCES